MHRILLAYSGDLHSSLALARLLERPRTEVVTVTVDIGQGAGVAAARERALALGALRAHAVDARDRFAAAILVPALQAGLGDGGTPPMTPALTAAAVVRELVPVAAIEHASAVASGCLPSTLGDRCWTRALRAVLPGLEIARATRADEPPAAALADARRRGVPRGPDDEYLWASRNLGGRSVAVPLDDDADGHASRAPLPPTGRAPLAPPAAVAIEFAAGGPVALNGVPLPLVELIDALDTLGSAHGIGRRIVLARELDESMIQVIDDAPAAVLLGAAYRELRRFGSDRDLHVLSAALATVHADLVTHGGWFSPARDALAAFFAAPALAGTVMLELSSGSCTTASVRPAEPRRGAAQGAA